MRWESKANLTGCHTVPLHSSPMEYFHSASLIECPRRIVPLHDRAHALIGDPRGWLCPHVYYVAIRNYGIQRLIDVGCGQ